nr:FecR domain-containing protein [Pedobacter xinjiangensis]
MNTIETPKGGEYQVILPDGTKVWLNSASVLTFPARFTLKNRSVKLIGEAYFEVAKDKQRPFQVNLGRTTVEVLGTHFNIAAYHDDPEIKTTLLEGSVKISGFSKKVVLQPGEQASVANDDISVSHPKLTEVMAWKNGYFSFNNEDIKSIMKKVSRWYDVDVEFVGNISSQQFGGTFNRSKTVEELLAHLEVLGTIKFKMKGRRIIVMN